MSSPHILGTDQPTAETPADLDSRRATPKHTNGLVRDPTSPLVCWGQLNRGHADGLRTFGSLLDLELDTLVFLERPKATAADLEKWTKTSFDPSSGVIKPKPLSPLNHFTVPCAIYLLLSFRADVPKHPRAL